MSLTIIPHDERERIVEIMDGLCRADFKRGPGYTAGALKRRYGINEEEYQMCMDFSMPIIRAAGDRARNRVKYYSLKSRISRLLETDKFNDLDSFKKELAKILAKDDLDE